eukprot:766008-Hanusia_phi.AAC.2
MAANVKGQVPCTCILLDTSASMNQKTSSNISLLDMAKAAIEQMVRNNAKHANLLVRRFPNERQHRFLLVTTRYGNNIRELRCSHPPNHPGGTVEAGWGDSQHVFLQKVTRELGVRVPLGLGLRSTGQERCGSRPIRLAVCCSLLFRSSGESSSSSPSSMPSDTASREDRHMTSTTTGRYMPGPRDSGCPMTAIHRDDGRG